MADQVPLCDDLIPGAAAIGREFGGCSERQAFYLLEKGIIPGFKLGRKWYARRSTLRALIEQREREAMAAAKAKAAAEAAQSRGPQPAPRRTRAA